MEALLAFYLGWSMGARSGPQGVEEINAALASLRQSEEFGAFVAALRKHAAEIMREVATHVEGAYDDPPKLPDMLAVVYQMFTESRGKPEA